MPAPCGAAREALAGAREQIAAGHEPGDLVEPRARSSPRAGRRPASAARSTRPASSCTRTSAARRSPSAALERVCEVARGYSNLEYDLRPGERGSRHDHLAPTLRTLDGRGGRARRQQQRSRGAARARRARRGPRGDRLARRADRDRRRVPHPRRARALGCAPARGRHDEPHAGRRLRGRGRAATTALLLRVHQSNFRIVGFTERPRSRSWRPSRGRHGLPLVDDLGSGSLVAFDDEPLVPDSIAAGADLVCFSGDKLLGGPQAGIVVGRAELVGRLRRHPLQRALRPDKLTLAALEGTLLLYLDPERALARAPGAADAARAAGDGSRPRRAARRRWSAARWSTTTGRVGGGALPLPRAAERRVRGRRRARASPLRLGEPPVDRARPRGADAARLPHDRRRRGRRARPPWSPPP